MLFWIGEKRWGIHPKKNISVVKIYKTSYHTLVWHSSLFWVIDKRFKSLPRVKAAANQINVIDHQQVWREGSILICANTEILFTIGKTKGQLLIFPQVDVPVSSPQGQTCNAQRNCKNHRAASQTLQASVCMLNIKVHDSIVKKNSWMCKACLQRWQKKKSLISSIKMAAQLSKVVFEQTTKLLERCLDRWDQSGDDWL